MSKKLLLSCVVIIIVGVAVVLWRHHHKAATKTTSLPVQNVQVATAKLVMQPETITSNGNLAAPQNTNISAQINGYVTKINYTEGQTVPAGMVLIQLDNRHQKAALASATAAAETSQLQLRRDQQLLKRGLIVQSAYYQAKVANEQNQASLAASKTSLADTNIRAPFSGTVGAITTSVGDYVVAGTTMTTLINTNNLRVDYTVPSRYFAKLKLGQTVTIHSATHPNQIHTGKVTYIASAIDPTSQTVMIHASMNNTQHDLAPGEFVAIKQVINPSKPTLLIPQQAIVADLNGYHIFTVVKGKAHKTAVKLGHRYDIGTEVVSGLAKGQQIVVAGQTNLRDGRKVKIVTKKLSSS